MTTNNMIGKTDKPDMIKPDRQVKDSLTMSRRHVTDSPTLSRRQVNRSLQSILTELPV